MRSVVTTSSLAIFLLVAHSGCAKIWTSSDYSDSAWSDTNVRQSHYSNQEEDDVWAEDDAQIARSKGSSSSSDSSSEISTTGIGAIAGAALGAGVGLVIGSTSGNAGEGFALGTAAGAAAGAGVGATLEAREELVEQQEIVAKQEAIISEQDRQLKELRRDLGEDGFRIPEHNVPSVSASPELSSETNDNVTTAARSRSRARLGVPVSPSEFNRNYDIDAPAPVQPQAVLPAVERGQSNSIVEQDLVTAPPAKIVPAGDAFAATSGAEPMLPPANVDTSDFQIKAKTNSPSRVKQAALGLPSAKTDTVELPALEAPEPVKPKAIARKVASPVKSMPAVSTRPAKAVKKVARRVPTPAEPIAKKVVVAKKPVVQKAPAKEVVKKKVEKKEPIQLAKQTVSQGCGDASREAKRGHEATSDADRLFYFRRAIRLCPEQAAYFVEVGKVYVNIGRTEDAQHEFSKALELDPENEEAQEQLSMIMMGATY